jgi:isopropylmalate/homocitrate/citramalate synthase
MNRRGYSNEWFVSWHNFEGTGAGRAQRFTIHDVTLRDGEQQAGVVFSRDDKIAIARALSEAGVDRIEAGMVAVSRDDRDTIRALVDMQLKPEIWTIARSLTTDIQQSIEADVAGVGVIILANDQYCKVFGWTVDEAMHKALVAANLAKSAGIQTTLLIADSSRMTPRLLEQIVVTASKSHVYDALALMDTFGALNPRGTAHLVRTVREMTDLSIEYHAHNDFGLATANSLAALEEGAEVIHTSVIGLGERVGNAALEEVVVAAPLLYERTHRVDLSKLCDLAKLVQCCSGVTVAANKAIVGSSYSQIESGAVAAEYTRLTAQQEDLQWLFPFRPSVVGAKDVELVIGKGSGAANVDAALLAAGWILDADSKRELLTRVKRESLRLHRVLTQTEFLEIAASMGARIGEGDEPSREARVREK